MRETIQTVLAELQPNIEVTKEDFKTLMVDDSMYEWEFESVDIEKFYNRAGTISGFTMTNTSGSIVTNYYLVDINA